MAILVADISRASQLLRPTGRGAALHVERRSGAEVVVPTHILGVDQWSSFLAANSISIDNEEAVYLELGYADYDSFNAALDSPPGILRQDVLDAWAVVQP